MSKIKMIHTKYVQRTTKQCKNPKKIMRLNKKKTFVYPTKMHAFLVHAIVTTSLLNTIKLPLRHRHPGNPCRLRDNPFLTRPDLPWLR